MPNIPTFENQIQPSSASPARADVGAAGLVGNTAAAAGAQLGGQMEQFVQRYADARRQVEAADTIAATSAKLGDAEFRWSKTPDRAAAMAGYQQESGQILNDAFSGVQSPLVLAHVKSQLDQENIARGLATGQQAFQLESSTRRGNLDTSLNQYAQSAATASSDPLRAIVTDNAIGAIKGAVAGGWLSPEDGAQREIGFRSQIQQVAAERDRNAVLNSRDPDAAIAWAAKVNDPTSYPGLLPQAREQLGGRAENIAYRLTVSAAAKVAHGDALADRQLRQAQSQNETTLLASVYSDKPPDTGALVDMAMKQQISPAGLQAIHSAINDQRQGRDDPATAVPLWASVSAGTASKDDVYNALSDRGIKGSTAVEMMKTLGARTQKGDDAIERGAFNQLKTALGGHAVEQGMLDFTKEAPRAQAALWTAAQGEWTNRVLAGNEAPQAVLTDMLQRYQRAPMTPAAWPQPRLGPIASVADVNAVAQRTQAAYDAGQLTPEQFDQEKQLLVQYGNYWQRQAARKPATVAPGGAKLRGVTPQEQ